MRYRTLAALCAASVVSVTSFGQPQPPGGPAEKVAGPRPSTPAAKPAAAVRSPQLLGEDGLPVAGVRVASADIKAVVRGPLAEAVMVLTFRNETDRVLGGELTFPLPDGATVAGYGLDVNGVLVDGVAVEKQQARVIYEKEMNKSVDPGLVEHVVGNNFRTRLYPIPAKGTRTIKVTYVADLIASEGGKGARLTLPMGLGDNLEALDLTVAVEGANEPPTVRGGSYTSKAFDGTPRGFYLRDSLKQAKAVDALTVSLPEVPATSAVVQRRVREPATIEELEAANAAAGAPADRRQAAPPVEHYFVLTDAPQQPRAEPVGLKNKRVLVAWDASLSRASADKARELAVLEQSLARLGHPTVDVALLRNDVEVSPAVGGGRADGTAKLIAFLKAVRYDGGTNLGALTLPKNLADISPFLQSKQAADYDLALLFTDGLSTVGKDVPAKVEVPVYAVSADPSANHGALRSICQQSGGVYLNLNRETDAAAVAAVGQPPFAVIGVEADPAKVADVTPGVGSAVGGRVTVAGRLLAPEASVTLVYGFGKTETSRRQFTLKQADATDGTLVPRFWAQQKANELTLAGDGQREDLVKLGKAFNLVTPATSLLVLETADQYVLHGVVPPKSRPDVYQAFQAKIETRKVEQAKTREEKVQQVLGMWNALKVWWGTEFKYPKDLKVGPPAPAKDVGGAAGLAAGAGGGGAGGRPATQPGESRHALPVAMPADAQDAARLPAERPGETPAAAARPAAGPPPATPSTPAPAGAAPAAEPGVVRNATADPAGHAQAQLQDMVRSGRFADESRSPGVDQRQLGRARGLSAAAADGTTLYERTNFADREKSDKDANGLGDAAAAIQIQTWDPNTPYLAAMKAVPADKAYDAYLGQRDQFAKSPAFYFDCADYLLRAGQTAAGVRVLTDVVELKLEDARLIRVAAHRLNQIGQTDLAIDLFERVLKLRPEEPQSYRDLALALAARADGYLEVAQPQRAWAADATSRAAVDYGRALELLNKVVTSNWDRFQEIEVIALMEANQIVAKLQRTPELGAVPIPLDPRLRQSLDCDVRIVLTWDADMTDIDLWVEEPSGEVCKYDHNRTQIGGAMSRDFTQGYGPEEYLLRKTMPGQYTVKANFYGSRQQELTGPCTVQATVVTDFGRPTEKRQAMTLRLANRQETVTVGTVTLK